MQTDKEKTRHFGLRYKGVPNKPPPMILLVLLLKKIENSFYKLEPIINDRSLHPTATV